MKVSVSMSGSWRTSPPGYLFPLPGQTAHTEIDFSILAEVCQKLSVSPSDVLAAIR